MSIGISEMTRIKNIRESVSVKMGREKGKEREKWKEKEKKSVKRKEKENYMKRKKRRKGGEERKREAGICLICIILLI